MTDKQIIECKYKFQNIEKFAGKLYCTLFNETCDFINFVCDKNCQVYEDYKQLKAKEQECEELKRKVNDKHNLLMQYVDNYDQIRKENEILKKYLKEENCNFDRIKEIMKVWEGN